MSSAKSKPKSSVNRQVKAAIGAVRDFIAGKSGEANVADSEDKALRQVVAAELLAAMSRREAEEKSRRDSKKSSRGADEESREKESAQQAARSDAGMAPSGESSAIASSDSESSPGEQEHALPGEEHERARQLFLDHGYFDEAVQDLRTAKSPAERAAAARALGVVGSQRGTAHLIAAMFDDDPEVRSAAGEALAQIGDPTVSNDPMSALLSSEMDSEAFHSAQAGAESGTDDAASQKSIARDRSGRFVRASKADEAAFQELVSDDVQVTDEQVTQQIEQHGIIDDSTAAREEEQLLLEEHAVRETIEQLERQLGETEAVRKESENEAQWRTEREAKLRADGAARRLEEEERRQRANEEAALQRAEEREAVTAEQEARLKAEEESHRLAEEESRLRLEAAGLRLAADELARQRADIETARREAAEAARHAEATRVRQEAESRHKAELERLHAEEEALHTAVEEAALRRTQVGTALQEAEAEIERLTEEMAKLAAAEVARRAEAERVRRAAEDRNHAEEEQLHLQLEGLRQVSEEVAARRAEVEAAREKADLESERLLETQARMRAAEEVRAQAEIERLQLEAEINQRVETEQRRLEEARRRAQEEQQRLEEDARRHTEEEEQRLAKLEVTRAKAEVEARQRAEKEQQILSQTESLRIADAEARKRIEEAEVRRRTAEEAYRLVAEKVQRVEAEAHMRATEEEQILAKLESVRRNVAAEAQARAEQEKRVKEEIEWFQRLEEEQRPRIEAAILQRNAAEARLQQQKARLDAEEGSRLRAEEELSMVGDHQLSSAEAPVQAEEQPDTIEDVWPSTSPVNVEAPIALAEENEADEVDQAAVSVHKVEGGAAAGVTPAIIAYLNSVDPYKRAAAVAELARSRAKDAFTLIADCFDDHSLHVRNAAARALRTLEPSRTVDLFNRALEEGSTERRRNIGAAIAGSGLAQDYINNLVSESREDTYNALSILFVMAKTGEVQPLVKAIEEHQNDEISQAVIKLLTLSGQSDIAEAAVKRRVNGRPKKAAKQSKG